MTHTEIVCIINAHVFNLHIRRNSRCRTSYVESVNSSNLQMKVRASFSQRNGLIRRLQRQRFLSCNRKFPGKRNFPLRPRNRPFLHSFPRFSVIYSVETKSSSVVPWQELEGPGIPNSSWDPPFLVLSRFLRSEWLSPISSFYVYALNFRLPMSLSDCSTLFSFARPVCVRSRLFFRFTRTRRCPSLPYSLSLVSLLSTRTIPSFSSCSCIYIYISFSRLCVHAYLVSFTYLVTCSVENYFQGDLPSCTCHCLVSAD